MQEEAEDEDSYQSNEKDDVQATSKKILPARRIRYLNHTQHAGLKRLQSGGLSPLSKSKLHLDLAYEESFLNNLEKHNLGAWDVCAFSHLDFETLGTWQVVAISPMSLSHFEEVKRALDAGLDWKEFKFFQDILSQIGL